MSENINFEIVNKIFSPSAPIDNIDLFIERTEEIISISETVKERGQHAVMFGGRGVGKTSIANVLDGFFDNLIIPKITCNRNDNFRSLWEKVLYRIQFVSTKKDIGFTPAVRERMEGLILPNRKNIDATDIEEIFYDLPNHVLIIFDEFDSIKDANTKMMMADTLKILSDNNSNVTVLIIGIAKSVNDLIGKHPSLERCIKQIEIPLMSSEQTTKLIKTRFAILKLEISDEIVEKIVEYSSGYPHYTHLLCKYISYRALANQDNTITKEHLDFAVVESINNSAHSLKLAYTKATTSSRKKNQFENVIFASILAEQDGSQNFSPDEVLEKYNELTEQKAKKESLYYNLGMLCKPERGLILKKTGSARQRKYQFSNPLMKAFVRLKLHK